MALLIAACFAIGSIGLLIAVLMEHSAAPSVARLDATTTPVSQADQAKQALIQATQNNQGNNPNSPPSDANGIAQQGSAAVGASSTAVSASQSPGSQAPSNDPDMSAHEEKLKMIRAMQGN